MNLTDYPVTEWPAAARVGFAYAVDGEANPYRPGSYNAVMYDAGAALWWWEQSKDQKEE